MVDRVAQSSPEFRHQESNWQWCALIRRDQSTRADKDGLDTPRANYLWIPVMILLEGGPTRYQKAALLWSPDSGHLWLV